MELTKVRGMALLFLEQAKIFKREHGSLVPIYMAMIDGAGRIQLEKGIEFGNPQEKQAAWDWINQQAQLLKPAVIYTIVDAYRRDPQSNEIVGEQIVVSAAGPGINLIVMVPYTSDGDELKFGKTEIMQDSQIFATWLLPWWEGGSGQA